MEIVRHSFRSLLATIPMVAALLSSGQALAASISAFDPAIAGWASGIHAYAPGPTGLTFFQNPALALGPAEGTPLAVTSLGRGGSITVTFDAPIYDGPGADFAVFENGIESGGGVFAELAWVDVSSDGVTYVRFPGFSRNDAPIGEFDTIDADSVSGLAGSYRAGLGTLFDLAIFKGLDAVDGDAIRYVRIQDIVGNGREVDFTPAIVEVPFGGEIYTVTTGCPCPIYDPFSPVLNGPNGFDLDAIGVIHQLERVAGTGGAQDFVVPGPSSVVPLPPAWVLTFAGLVALGRYRSSKWK